MTGCWRGVSIIRLSFRFVFLRRLIMTFRRLALWCACTVVLGLSAVAQPYSEAQFKGMKWRNVGPFRGGRVLAVTGVVGSPFTYYFGGVAGGVWRTTDGGV